MSDAKPRLRTWSAFGDIRRKPTEYEIVTHDLNHTTRDDRIAPLEANPHAPVNMWLSTYRDRSPLQCDDWNAFRDPDELTYRRYVAGQARAETVTDGVLDEYDEAGHDARMAGPWIEALATVFTPLRFPFHGLQLCEAYIGMIAPTSYVTNCAAFAAADLLRATNVVAYRTRQLAMAHPDAGFADGERAVWQEHAAWQPVRRAIETALVAYDLGEALTAVNLVLRPTLDHVLLHGFAEVARANDDDLTWLLLTNLRADADRCGRWSTALARYCVTQRPENEAAFDRWIRRWEPRAEDAAGGLAGLVAALPGATAPAEDLVRGAAEARSERIAATRSTVAV